MANPNPKPPPKHGQIKKGEVRNPLGGKAHNPATRALRKLTVETYREVIQLVLDGRVRDLQAMASDPETPAIQVGIAVSFLKAIKNGDYHVIERIAERIVGKIPDVIKVDPLTVNQKVTIIDRAALAKAMAELDKEY